MVWSFFNATKTTRNIRFTEYIINTIFKQNTIMSVKVQYSISLFLRVREIINTIIIMLFELSFNVFLFK